MKKKITMQELKSLIKEEAQKLQRRTILEGEKKSLINELEEVFYGDSDGDYEFDKETKQEVENLYDRGHELFNKGDKFGAEELRKQALKKASWLGWGENDLPEYKNVKKFKLRAYNHFFNTMETKELANQVLEKARIAPVENGKVIVYYSDEGMCIFITFAYN